MPIINEKKKGRELGFKDPKRTYIWAACPDCGKERWVCFRIRGKGSTFSCHPCAAKHLRGENHPNWKGGKVRHSEGYIEVKVLPDDFFFSMASSTGYIPEHRLVMARSLQRCLLPWEIVHHKNGDRADNRLENLQLLPGKKYHIADTLSKSLLKTMESRIKYLENLLALHGIKF